MKPSAFLLVVAALVLPELSWAKCDDAKGPSLSRCQCNYDGTEDGNTVRCVFHGTKYGARHLCSCADCPETYKGYGLRDVDSISQPMYNGRHKCRDNE
ncbi:hypothetical protein Vi05172_g1260 [Venturia inaequalis]|nr:hypothetical protein Vi05172_g1260 [Venturia inaequalis]